VTVTVGLVGLMVALGFAGGETFRREGRPGPAIGSLFAAIWISFLLIRSLAMPQFDLYHGQTAMAQRVSWQLPDQAALAVVEIPDPQITYYLPLPMRRFDRWSAFEEHWQSRTKPKAKQPLFVVGPRRLIPQLRSLGDVRIIDRADSIHPDKTEASRMITARLMTDD